MIDPRLLQAGFRIGVFILIVALAMLPFEPRDSAELIVTVLSAIVGAALVLGIAALARWGQRPPPDDDQDQTRYNTRFRRRGP